MVTPLQLAPKIVPAEELLAKSPTRDFEAVSGSVSFGEILKAKEKELQKALEVNMATVAAALAAMQAQPQAAPVNGETVRTEARSVLKATAPLPVPAQTAAPTSPTVNASAPSETDLAPAAAAGSLPVPPNPAPPPVDPPRQSAKSPTQPASSSTPAADLPVFGPVVAEAGPQPAPAAPAPESQPRTAARQPATRLARPQLAAVAPASAPAVENPPQSLRPVPVSGADILPIPAVGHQPQPGEVPSHASKPVPVAVVAEQPVAQSRTVVKAPAVAAHPMAEAVMRPVSAPMTSPVAQPAPVATQPPLQDSPVAGDIPAPAPSTIQTLPQNEPAPTRASITESRTTRKVAAAQPTPAVVVTEQPEAPTWPVAQAPVPVSHTPEPRIVPVPQPAEPVTADMLEPRAPMEARENEKPAPTPASAPVENRQPAPKPAPAREASPVPVGPQPAPSAPPAEKLTLPQDTGHPAAAIRATRPVEVLAGEPVAGPSARPTLRRQPVAASPVELQPQVASDQPSLEGTAGPVVTRPEAQPVLQIPLSQVAPRPVESQPEPQSVALSNLPDVPASKPALKTDAPAVSEPVTVDMALQQAKPVETPARWPLGRPSFETTDVPVNVPDVPELRPTAREALPAVASPQPEPVTLETEVVQPDRLPRAMVQDETLRPAAESRLPEPQSVVQAAGSAPAGKQPVETAKNTLPASVPQKDAPNLESHPVPEQPYARPTVPAVEKTEPKVARPAPVETTPQPVLNRPEPAASSPVLTVMPGKPVEARLTQKTAPDAVPTTPDAEPGPVGQIRPAIAQPAPTSAPARSAEFHAAAAPLSEQMPAAAHPNEAQGAEPAMPVTDSGQQPARPVVSHSASPEQPPAPRLATRPVEVPPQPLAAQAPAATHHTPTLAGEPAAVVSQPTIGEIPAQPVERLLAKDVAPGGETPQVAELRPGVVDRLQPDPVAVPGETSRPVTRQSAQARPESQPVAAQPPATPRPQAQLQSTPVAEAPAQPLPVPQQTVEGASRPLGAPGTSAQPVEGPKVLPADTRKPLDTAPQQPAVAGQAEVPAAAPVASVPGRVAELRSAAPFSIPAEKELARPDRPHLARENSAPVEAPQPDAIPVPERLAAVEASVLKPADQGPATLPGVRAAELVEQVVKQLHSRLDGGPTSMHLQLHPAELGAIDVQVTSNAQGVSVSFITEQASTGRLLETQANQLRQALTESGVQLTGLNINQHGQPGQQGGFFQQNPQFASPPRRDVPQPEPVVVEKARVELVAGQVSGIDYLI